MDTRASPNAVVHGLDLAAVALGPGFWADRVRASREGGIPRLLERLDEHGVLANFDPGAAHRGFWFTDSDLYKWLEGAAWSVGSHPDPELAARIDAVVGRIAAAAEPDGYLDTGIMQADRRFADLSWSHELYCLGHLVQAALALSRSIGDDRLVRVAARFADLVDATLGPDSGRTDTDLHPGVETALVELARHTGNDRYRRLARELVDRVELGEPVELRGHAVRAAYFASGIADLLLDGDTARRDTLDALWASMVERKAYVTGGLGGRWIGESVGRDYELPAEGAYAETCAAIAVVHWAWRMLQLTGDSVYTDHLELVLHNAFLAGVSLGGDEWFYANPLTASGAGDHDPWDNDRLAIAMAGPFPLARRPWRDVTCCPPNVVRMLASLPGYLAGESTDALWIHLYTPSIVEAAGMRVRVDTGLPWSGTVTVTVEAVPAGARTLRLRVPEWARGATLDGAPVDPGYASVTRGFVPDEAVTLELPVVPGWVVAHPRLAETRGAVALRLGPLVYCLESVDNPGVDVLAAAVDPTVEPVVVHRPDLLGGVNVAHVAGSVLAADAPLYQERTVGRLVRPVNLTAVPYALWANRGPSAMTVWMRAVS